MQPVRAVCFDFQETLAYYAHGAYANYVRAAAEHGVAVPLEAFVGQPLEDAWAPYRTADGIDHSAASVDERSYSPVRASVHLHRLRSAGVEGAAGEAIARRIMELEAQPEQYRLFDDTLPALERLRAAGVRALVVSNHIWRLPELMAALGLGGYLAGVLTSARVGVRKPHPRIYAAALAQARCEPADVLFVGDDLRNDVTGPRAAGMRAVLLARDAATSLPDAIQSLAKLAELA